MPGIWVSLNVLFLFCSLLLPFSVFHPFVQTGSFATAENSLLTHILQFAVCSLTAVKCSCWMLLSAARMCLCTRCHMTERGGESCAWEELCLHRHVYFVMKGEQHTEPKEWKTETEVSHPHLYDASSNVALILSCLDQSAHSYHRPPFICIPKRTVSEVFWFHPGCESMATPRLRLCSENEACLVR